MNTDTKVIGGIVTVTVLMIVGLTLFGGQEGSTTEPIAVDDGQVTRDYSPRKGAATAPVQLVEFGDFQCPACGRVFPLINQALTEYGDQLSFTWRHYPLTTIHSNALPASRAAAAAGAQGKFFEMYDLIFAGQSEWSSLRDTSGVFAGYATTLGLDLNQYQTDLTNDALLTQIQTDMGDGNALGVNGTPSFYINNEPIDAFVSYDALKASIDAALAR